MAIKGKGKTKPRQAAKAPRRGPVAVPTPFVRRRWVQVTAAVTVGVLGAMFVIWITNALRAQGEDDRLARERVSQQEALTQWQATVNGQLGTVGQIQDPLPPSVAPQLAAALADIAKGEKPALDADQLATTRDDLEAAAKALEDFDLAGTVRDRGFGAEVESLITGRTEFVEGLKLIEQAAALAALALEALDAGDQALAEDLAKEGTSLHEAGNRLIADAWRKYQNVLTLVGLRQPSGALTGGVPALP